MPEFSNLSYIWKKLCRPRLMSEAGYMAHQWKMLHIPMQKHVKKRIKSSELQIRTLVTGEQITTNGGH